MVMAFVPTPNAMPATVQGEAAEKLSPSAMSGLAQCIVPNVCRNTSLV